VEAARVSKRNPRRANLRSVLRNTGLSKSTKRASSHVLQSQRDRFKVLEDLVASVFADIPIGWRGRVMDPRFVVSAGVAKKHSDFMEPSKVKRVEGQT
jgi:hypothetical protein